MSRVSAFLFGQSRFMFALDHVVVGLVSFAIATSPIWVPVLAGGRLP